MKFKEFLKKYGGFHRPDGAIPIGKDGKPMYRRIKMKTIALVSLVIFALAGIVSAIGFVCVGYPLSVALYGAVALAFVFGCFAFCLTVLVDAGCCIYQRVRAKKCVKSC